MMKSSSFFLVLLFASELCQPVKSTFTKFKKQHIKEDMKEDECDSVIRERNIRAYGNKCKPKNTFILDNIQNVKRVCNTGIEVKQNFYKSNETFPIILCTRKNNTGNICEYDSSEQTINIVILCIKGKPVHYEDPDGYCHIMVP